MYIILPRLLGSRESAKDIVKNKLLKVENITLDATKVEAASQSYADEIIQQTISQGYNLKVIGGTKRLRENLLLSAKRRNLTDKLEII